MTFGQNWEVKVQWEAWYSKLNGLGSLCPWPDHSPGPVYQHRVAVSADPEGRNKTRSTTFPLLSPPLPTPPLLSFSTHTHPPTNLNLSLSLLQQGLEMLDSRLSFPPPSLCLLQPSTLVLQLLTTLTKSSISITQLCLEGNKKARPGRGGRRRITVEQLKTKTHSGLYLAFIQLVCLVLHLFSVVVGPSSQLLAGCQQLYLQLLNTLVLLLHTNL